MTKTLTHEENRLIGFYLDLLKVRHAPVREHCIRVARYAARAARRLGKDTKAAYLGGIFHDLGKVLIDPEFFTGRDVTAAEFIEIQQHARMGYEAMKGRMIFTSLCCGLHHTMGKGGGYGIKLSDLPPSLSPRTAKKVLEIAEIVAVADFVDAFSTRTTTLRDGGKGDLRTLLIERFPETEAVVAAVLAAAGLIDSRLTTTSS